MIERLVRRDKKNELKKNRKAGDQTAVVNVNDINPHP